MAEAPTPYISVNPDGSFEAPSEPGTYPLHIPFELLHPAPAAPSVGEPEPDTALFGTHIREAMRVIRAPAVEEPRQDTPPDADSAPLSFEDAVRNGRMAETIPALRAELSALRSSLEEARKDSERLDWLMTTAIDPWTRASIDTARGEA